jgi:hypothetical protein
LLIRAPVTPVKVKPIMINMMPNHAAAPPSNAS